LNWFSGRTARSMPRLLEATGGSTMADQIPQQPDDGEPLPTTRSSGDAVVVQVARLDAGRHPDLQGLQSVVLREGPRRRREAVYTVIRNRHTGEPHHDSLTIRTVSKHAGSWREKPEHTLTLTDEDGTDEIQLLADFLAAARRGLAPEGSREYVVLATPEGGLDVPALQRALGTLSSTQQVEAITDVLEGVSRDPELLRALVRRASQQPELFAEAAAALNLATYRRALRQLKASIETPGVPEQRFQELLAANPWMFGSEYSELLDRRRWTRDEQQDFVLRRTTDGYIELIEIKTPLDGAPLFGHDRSHDSYYANAPLSKVLGQVQKYIERVDSDRDRIRANDGEDTAKIRAKIIIGRDGDDDQRAALRRLNGHLHRIEVITFDQLLRIAERTVEYLIRVLRPPEASGAR
jgi:hypothetical protein